MKETFKIKELLNCNSEYVILIDQMKSLCLMPFCTLLRLKKHSKTALIIITVWTVTFAIHKTEL